MSSFIFNKSTEINIIPKKFAIKYDPPEIALEYLKKSEDRNMLISINLQEFINYDSNDICTWIFESYSDVFSHQFINEKQIISLVDKIKEKRNKNKDVFSKSDQNFYVSQDKKLNENKEGENDGEKYLEEIKKSSFVKHYNDEVVVPKENIQFREKERSENKEETNNYEDVIEEL